MAINLFSKTLNKEVELETAQENSLYTVPSEDYVIVKIKSLKKILNDLDVDVSVVPEAFGIPVVAYAVTIKSKDLTVEERGSVNISIEQGIPAQYPAEIAYNRAIGNAIIAYLNFDKRVYSESSMNAINEKPKTVFDVPEEDRFAMEDVFDDEPNVFNDNQYGNAIWDRGIMKGKTLNEIYNSDIPIGKAKNGKEYLEFFATQGKINNHELDTALKKFMEKKINEI